MVNSGICPCQAGGCRHMIANVAEVRLLRTKQILECDGGNHFLAQGDQVVVDSARGHCLGQVFSDPLRKLVDPRNLVKLVRPLNEEDRGTIENNRKLERLAFEDCQLLIQRHALPMKLINVEFTHCKGRAIFYFSAEGRVDFRLLVKDLAHRFRVRIEMRQVGVRDEARMTGGIGSCGRELCCTTFLRNFEPVSIRMAKDQNLALSPQKVSGVCGRLMCCLVYEEKTYKELRKGLPKIGKRIITPHGEGRVKEVDVLRGRVRIVLENGLIQDFRTDELVMEGLKAEGALEEALPEALEMEDILPAGDDGVVESLLDQMALTKAEELVVQEEREPERKKKRRRPKKGPKAPQGEAAKGEAERKGNRPPRAAAPKAERVEARPEGAPEGANRKKRKRSRRRPKAKAAVPDPS